MQNDTIGLIKNALIEYVKSHNGHNGKLWSFLIKLKALRKLLKVYLLKLKKI